MYKTICRAPGCNKTAEYPLHYCKEHSYMEADKKDYNTAISFYAPTYTYLYRTKRWKEESKEFLRVNDLCCNCGDKATVVDHIIPHKGNEELFWDQSNWEPLCKKCHDIKTREEIKQRQMDSFRDRELKRRYGTSWDK